MKRIISLLMVLAMLLSAFLVILPVVAVILGLFCLFAFLFFA